MDAKCNTGLEDCKSVSRFSFDRGFQYLKYAVLVTGHKPRFNDSTKTHLDDLAFNGVREGAEFSKVDFNCLRGNIL